MDMGLAAEVTRKLPIRDRPLSSVITSDKLMTATHAKICGILDDDTCCFCKEAPQTWQHLWFKCSAFTACRNTFGPIGHGTPKAKDLKCVCDRCLFDPSFLPPVLANCGAPMEMGPTLRTTGGPSWPAG